MLKYCRLCFLLALVILVSCGDTDRPESITIKIIQTSDVHGLLFPYDHINHSPAEGSLARVHRFVEDERANNDQVVILLDNGDILQGQPMVYYYNFENQNDEHILTRVMNFMKYDAATVGNHDIEAGHEVYDRVVAGSGFPWLAANILKKGTEEPYFKPYTILEVEGIKIAVMGLITSMVPEWLPETLWVDMEFLEMVPEAERWMQIVQEKEKPDIVVGLFHEGFGSTRKDGNNGESIYENGSAEVASLVPGFDVVLIGHDHREWNTQIQNSSGNSVLVMGPGSHARQVSVAEIDLTYNRNSDSYIKEIKGEIVSLAGVEPDNAFMKEFEKEIEEVNNFVTRRIGEFSETISSRDAMFGSSAFVDLIHMLQIEITGAQISFAAPLSFDAEISRGEVNVGDMFNLYRYENFLYTMELSGKEIKDYLEFSYGNWYNHMQDQDDLLLLYRRDEKGDISVSSDGQRYLLAEPSFNFDSAAGIDYTVDVSKPEGSRIKISKLSNGDLFSMEATYSVAINSYRGSGGGGHLESGAGIPAEEFPDRIISSTQRDLRHYLIRWIEENNVVDPRALNNWEVIPADWSMIAREREAKLLYGN
ncbi:MAG: bifunctional metallophosphatase/5'-nucleotidase [Bacteroidales bacterium]